MDTDPVGPRFSLGPIPRYGADHQDVTDPASTLVFFRTTSGYCTEFGSGSGCSGGGPGDGLPNPGDGVGFGGSVGGGETCIESVTAKDIVKLVVELPDDTTFPLGPLPGSAATPVNVFAACWEQDLDFEAIDAIGYRADGTEVFTLG